MYHYLYSSSLSPVSPPLCTCGVHMSFSRGRLRMINDNERNDRINQSLGEVRGGALSLLLLLLLLLLDIS